MKTWQDIAGTARAGTIYGIGVGPGDPALMTLRAAGLISSVDVIAFFAKRGRSGNARTIISPLMSPDRRELRLDYPVTDEIAVDDPDYKTRMRGFYAEAAAHLGGLAAGGASVGLLSEGDPFLYGSFMHMWRRLNSEVAVEVVPGVTGMSGCWTRAGAPIAWGDDMLTVLPATLPEAVLRHRLSMTDAAVIMKLGRNLEKARRAITAAGLADRAIYIERGTMPGERIVPLRDQREDGPYFSMILIPGEGRRL